MKCLKVIKEATITTVITRMAATIINTRVRTRSTITTVVVTPEVQEGLSPRGDRARPTAHRTFTRLVRSTTSLQGAGSRKRDSAERKQSKRYKIGPFEGALGSWTLEEARGSPLVEPSRAERKDTTH